MVSWLLFICSIVLIWKSVHSTLFRSRIMLHDIACAIVRGKKGFTSKRIVLLSNVCHEFADDQLDDIIGGLKEAEIEFDIM